MTTEQEAFWKGDFGTEYQARNTGRVKNNVHLFDRALQSCWREIEHGRILEVGAGMGENLLALRELVPEAQLHAMEINPTACAAMQALGFPVMVESILDWRPAVTWDLVFTKGVLIHIAPEHIFKAYRNIVDASHRYILVAEYYNPTPVEVAYRGHAGRLWKRDFAGDLLEQFDLRLMDDGFAYHLGPYPQDDITWFLLEKRS